MTFVCPSRSAHFGRWPDSRWSASMLLTKSEVSLGASIAISGNWAR